MRLASIGLPFGCSASLTSLLLAGLLLAGAASSEPLARDAVPAPLAEWVDWVLHDANDALCPSIHGAKNSRRCSWPSRLELALDDRGGSFEQTWRIDAPEWIALPGDEKFWPQDVRVGEKGAAVVKRAGRPSLHLERGAHRIRGRLAWSKLPPSLAVPIETGLVSLSLRGKSIALPKRDAKGQLWLRSAPRENESSEQRLEVAVFRNLRDEIPLLLETRIELKVAGSSREELLSRALPEGFIPMSLSGPLPARIEADGRVRIQVRPGEWTLTLEARHVGPAESLTAPPVDGPWASEELWSFTAQPQLRVVEVRDAPAIDPQQTRLPREWHHLPSYVVKAGEALRFVEKRRGDADPAPDRLALQRTLWLDFDGRGLTAHDELAGTLSRSWRLQMTAPTELGRVAIDGRDQLITRSPGPDGSPITGVEVRQGQVALDADSRIEGRRAQLPAVGWAHDFESVTAQLNLPPGWRLFHASGVDSASDTWIAGWSLLEIFLVLVTAMAIGELRGRRWAALALLTLVLTYPEAGAPRWTWLVVVAMLALTRVLPERHGQRFARSSLLLGTFLIAIAAIPFAVNQVRTSIYPALERPYMSIDTSASFTRAEALRGPDAEFDALEAPRLRRMAADSATAVAEYSQEAAAQAAKVLSSPAPGSPGRLGSYASYAPDPAARVSTGPGLPRWQWNAVSLDWTGPVTKEQTLGLWLAPPWLNSLLGFLRAGLVGALALCVLGGLGSLRAGLAAAGTSLRVGVLLVSLLPAVSGTARAADFPPDEMLAQLRARLLEAPSCSPFCAESPRMRLEARGDALAIVFEVDASARTAVPLPGSLAGWSPEMVLVNEVQTSGLARSPDGTLWLALAPGRHRIDLIGRLPEQDSVQLPLPLLPHALSASVEGWTLDGQQPDGPPAATLQLSRVRSVEPTQGAALEASDLPAFVRVERRISLGLEWSIETRIQRLTPGGRSVFLELPLLAGESVTTDGVRVEQGRVRVSLSSGERSKRWRSTLEAAESLSLVAPDSLDWSEVWIVDASPAWHVEAEGIPQIHRPTDQSVRLREWQPWPGERVELRITRPVSSEGATLTIDRSALTLRPGRRTVDSTLSLTLRSSRGEEHAIRLPEAAELQSVTLDGNEQPIRAVEGLVSLSVAPGKHEVTLVWTTPGGFTSWFRSQTPILALPSANADLAIEVPDDRWLLLIGGPRMGPAVLFWSTLLVAFAMALVLGRLPLTPIPWHGWMLLFVGLTQVPLVVSLGVVAWLLALGFRRTRVPTASRDLAFNGLQIGLVLLSVFALGSLVFAVQQGLLGTPEMQIAGNGSTSDLLRWYRDRNLEGLPTAWIVSVPLLVYRFAMLAWALWLALAILRWLRWGWECFSAGGLWSPMRKRDETNSSDPNSPADPVDR